MTKLVWNKIGEHFYETGVDRGVLYPRNGFGVPWNGLISVNESAAGGEIEELYFDGIKYLDFAASEDFKATLDAFSSPPEFADCDGSKTIVPGLFVTQQPKKMFDLSYRTLIGNDLDGTQHGYKLHLVYNATAAPAPRQNQTVNDGFSSGTRQWEINTIPVISDNLYKPTAHFVVDSTLINPYTLDDLERILYGSNKHDPRLPTQNKVIELLVNKITEPITEPI